MATEEINFKNANALRLSGLHYKASKKAEKIVVMSHGFMNDRDESGKFSQIAKLLEKKSISSLLFDYSGSGKSEKTAITVKGQVNDLKAAIHYAKQLGYKKIGLLGLSLGGLYCILAYDISVKAIVLWAPVTASKVPTKLNNPDALKDFEQFGYTILNKRNGQFFKIDKKYLQERLSVDQREILLNIKCPVMIIHGSNDNIVPLSHSEKAVEYLSESSRLWILEGADHCFQGYIDVVVSLSLDWLTKNL